MTAETAIAFVPLLPWAILAVIAGLSAAVVALGLWRRARGILIRAIALAILLTALANPSLVLEERDPIADIAVVIVDDSPSQNIGKRRERTEAALAHARAALAKLRGIETRIVRVRGGEIGQSAGTRLFAALERALGDVSRRRLAGVVMITDGQVHDAPLAKSRAKSRAKLQAKAGKKPEVGLPGPIHVLITGERQRGDRRLSIVRSPSYGLVGKPLGLTIRVEDTPRNAVKANPQKSARLTIKRDGKPWRTVEVPVGSNARIDFKLVHTGPTYFEIEVERGPRELTLLNNRAVVSVSGVRDRLRVLLVSGEPHPGERAWRNLLKSDPAVDLVHFTILRPPEKQDLTPVHELSLISFPVRELFDLKLKEFDLIIFDRYRRRGVLLSSYLRNIARYVEGGGALLVAVGPKFASPLSLYNTPLGAVLPGRPTGRMTVRGFRPLVTKLGKRHPVAANLSVRGRSGKWGRWFRQIEVSAPVGHTLMSGIDGRPLLLLNRVGKGRVVQLLSDQIWLWGRGYEGGGPQAELMRRVAHWLMKEPELEENDLRASVRDGRLEILRRSLEPDPSPVTVTLPSGKKKTLRLTDIGGGSSRAILPVNRAGLYQVSDGKRSTVAAAGALNALEMAEVGATADKLRPAVAATGGAIVWLAEDKRPAIRSVRPGRLTSGRGGIARTAWLGFRANGDYVVTGIREFPLLPAILVLLLGLGALMLAWRREGK